MDLKILYLKIHDELLKILKDTFPTGSAKQKIIIHNDRLQFSCVFCHDSAENPYKKRGNIYLDSMMYHCYNGGCDTHMNLFDFLKLYNALDNFTQDEILFIKNTSYQQIDKYEKYINLKYDVLTLSISKFICEFGIDKDIIKKEHNLINIEDSNIKYYLLNRLQKKWNNMLYDAKKNEIYIFNEYNGKILGYQKRIFNNNVKYLTYNYNKIYKLYNLNYHVNDDMMRKLNILSTLFGIFNVDFNKYITIFEGPFDSFLYPNSIATCSANNKFPFDLPNLRFFFDNDETGLKKTIEILKEKKYAFVWEKYLKDNNINEKIKDLTDLLVYIKKHPNQKFTKISNYFFNSLYDLW